MIMWEAGNFWNSNKRKVDRNLYHVRNTLFGKSKNKNKKRKNQMLNEMMLLKLWIHSFIIGLNGDQESSTKTRKQSYQTIMPD
mmetsp:Transcript_24912/g.45032  ORF Transcript_24912/g.45032 Transcript_24912/m.45032 type:complete len:83 (+) Transcript_24912:265-513(+)